MLRSQSNALQQTQGDRNRSQPIEFLTLSNASSTQALNWTTILLKFPPTTDSLNLWF